MRKKWIWVILFLVTLMAVLLGWYTYPWQSSPQGAVRSQPWFDSSVVPPAIDADRIFADVVALSFQRYQEADRLRTREYLLQSLQDAGWTAQTQTFPEGVNVYAERPGTEPAAGKILLAAHYDTVEISPGADDNASSVATVLEAARLLGQIDTPRTLQVAFFDQEETGLFGSQAFADLVAQDKAVRGAIVLDMIGYACHEEGCQTYPEMLPITPPTDRGDFLAVIGDQGHSFLIDSFTQPTQPSSPSTVALPQILTMAIPTLGRLTPDLLRSDHVPFWRNSIGAVLVTDTANFRNPHYHQPSDTPETLDRAFFVGAAQQVVNATTRLLASPE